MLQVELNYHKRSSTQYNFVINKKMRLNIGKCKIIMISKYPNLAPLIYINNTPLETVVGYKCLGVEINNKIKWDQQWKKVREQRKSVPYLLKRLINLISKRTDNTWNVITDIKNTQNYQHNTRKSYVRTPYQKYLKICR